MRWVVVGGGTAGCVIAARLSERADHEVVLLEAGPDHGSSAPGGDVGPLLSDPERLRVEQVVRRPGREPEPYWQGSGLGGSSLVHGTVVMHDPAGSPDLATAGVATEAPWAVGRVGAALLATDPRAARVRLVRARGRRLTAADAFLRPARDRPGLTVRTEAAVARVRLAGRRVVGVELVSGEFVAADRVVLCAGAIRTPTILLRSGVDTPGVGEGLQDHPAFTITLALRADAVDASVPTISVAAGHGDHQVLALDHLPGAPALGALSVGLTRVRSIGRLSLPSPDAEPLVELRQFTDPADAAALCRAVASTLDLLGRPAWRAIAEGAYIDAAGTPAERIAGSAERIAAWVTDHAGGHYHVAGTCADGVVTDGGVVRGYVGLSVCDASLFRGVPPVDPYVAVIALAERTVRSWLGHGGPPARA